MCGQRNYNNNEQQTVVADTNRSYCSVPVSGIRSVCRVFSSAYQAYSQASERAQPYTTILNTLAVFLGTWALLFYFNFFKNDFNCQGRPFDLSCPDVHPSNGTNVITELEGWLGEGSSDEFRQSVVHGLGIAGLQVIFVPFVIVSAPILGVGLDKLVEAVRRYLYGTPNSSHTNPATSDNQQPRRNPQTQQNNQHQQLTTRDYLRSAFTWSSYFSKGTALSVQLILLVSWFPQQLNSILESLGCQSRDFWQILTMNNDSPHLKMDDSFKWGCSPVNYTKAFGGAVGKWWMAIVTSLAFSYALFNSIGLASVYWRDQVLERVKQFKDNWRHSRAHAGALTAYNTFLSLIAMSPPILLWRLVEGVKEANTVLHWEGCQNFLKAVTVSPLGYHGINSSNIEPLDEKIPSSLQQVLEKIINYDVTELRCALKQVLEGGLAYTFQAEIATLFMWGPLVGVGALAIGYAGGWMNAACINPPKTNNNECHTPEQTNREHHSRRKLEDFIQRLEAFKNKMTQDWYEPMESIFKVSLYSGIGLTVLFYGLPWLHQLLHEADCTFGDALRAKCGTTLLAMALGVNGNIPWAVGTASAFTGLSGFFVYRLATIVKDRYWLEEPERDETPDNEGQDGLANYDRSMSINEVDDDWDRVEEYSPSTLRGQSWCQRFLQFLGCASGRPPSVAQPDDEGFAYSQANSGPSETNSDLGTVDDGRNHIRTNPRKPGRRWYWPDVDTSTRAGNPFDQSHDENNLAGDRARSLFSMRTQN